MYGIPRLGDMPSPVDTLGQAGAFMLVLLAGVTLLAWRAATK